MFKEQYETNTERATGIDAWGIRRNEVTYLPQNNYMPQTFGTLGLWYPLGIGVPTDDGSISVPVSTRKVDGYPWTENWHHLKLEQFNSKDSKELWKLLQFCIKARYQAVLQRFERNSPSKSEFCNADLNWEALLNLSGNFKKTAYFSGIS